jgi:hypothetical protein
MGELIIEHYYKYTILILFIGGLTGWILFGLAVKYLLMIRLSQVNMIQDIKQEITHLKSEIRQLK